MFPCQKSIVSRWKEWQPLPTHQLRLRSLVQIIGINLGLQDLEGKICRGSSDDASSAVFYFTLHVTAMSAPFYTSEKLPGKCPKWKEIDPSFWGSSNFFGGAECFVIRLWVHPNEDIVKVFGVNLSGLLYLGPNLVSITLPTAPNSVIFLLPGGYYSTTEENVIKPVKLTIASSLCRHSYSLSVLKRINKVHITIHEQQAETDAIKLKISSGKFMPSDRRGSAALRKILNKHRPQSSQADINKLKEAIELARCRKELLEHEKRILLSRVSSAKAKLEAACDSNQIKESRTMERYRVLQKSVQRHREWIALHVQRRETQLHAKALLNFRMKQLVSELHQIYPIEEAGGKFSICGVNLPDSEDLNGVDDIQLSVALGFVAHAVEMISSFLQVPLRYPVTHYGSRSQITDLIAPNLPDTERDFPLFCKGKDRMLFKYGVYLINKDIAGLRLLCGLGTRDLRQTLYNLAGLFNISGVEIASPSSSTREPGASINIPSQLAPRYRTPAPSFNHQRPDGISYSLDKGLNEIERIKSEQMGGSESRLCIAEDASQYLNWQNPTSIISDEGSDTCRPGMFLEKTVSVIHPSSIRKISFGQEAYDDSLASTVRPDGSSETLIGDTSVGGEEGAKRNVEVIEPEAISAVLESNTKSLVDAVEKPLSAKELETNSATENTIIGSGTDGKIMSSGSSHHAVHKDPTCVDKSRKSAPVDRQSRPLPVDPISEFISKPKTVSPLRSPEKSVPCRREEVPVDVEAVEAFVVEDSFQDKDDVADRAEALSSHTSSFNMFRSRLRSGSGAMGQE